MYEHRKLMINFSWCSAITRRLVITITINLIGTGLEVVAQDMDQRRTVENTVIDLRVP